MKFASEVPVQISRLFISRFLLIWIFFYDSIFTCRFWTVSFIPSTFGCVFKGFFNGFICFLFKVVSHHHKGYFKVLVLCFGYGVFLRATVVGLLCWGGDILSWLLRIMFTHWCLGFWVWDGCISRCWYLPFSLLGGYFVPSFLLAPVFLRKIWWLCVTW